MPIAIPDCLQGASLVRLDPETRVFEAGDVCSHFYYLLSGSIRVDLLTRSGKPVMLYRFGEGETCILTTSCLLSGDPYMAEATTERAVEALALPVSSFQAQLNSSASFRGLVFKSFASRLSAMMAKIEAVTSIPIDQRLAARTLELAQAQQGVVMTHEQLASELGTAREVISRKLARWEAKGWIRRGRGRFDITDRSEIEKLATNDSSW